jgi:hypothetical protein
MSRRAGGSGGRPPVAATAFLVSVSAFFARSLKAAAKLDAGWGAAAAAAAAAGDSRGAAGLRACGGGGSGALPAAVMTDGGRGGTGEKEEGAPIELGRALPVK